MIFQHTLKRLAIVEEDLFVVLLLILAVSMQAMKPVMFCLYTPELTSHGQGDRGYDVWF